MKKILVIVAVVAISMSSFAQTQKGKIFVSGSSDLSFASMKMNMEYDGEKQWDDDLKTTEFNLKPSVGYFIIDNLALGLTMDITNSKQKMGDVESKSTSLMIGPAVRYYFGSSNIKPYVNADYIFGSQKEDDEKLKMSGWDLGAGVGVFLNEIVSLDLGLGYGSMTLTYDEDSKAKMKASGIAFTAGFSIFF